MNQKGTKMANRVRKVLVIEDDNALSSALISKMKNAGIEALAAFDGQTGLQKAISEIPDLILLDIVLPKLDGIEVLTQLKAVTELKNTPVIMLSNLSEKDAAEQCLEKGATAYLVKVESKIDDVLNIVKSQLKN